VKCLFFRLKCIFFAAFSGILLLTCKKDDPKTPVDPKVSMPDLFLTEASTSKDNGLILKLKVNRVPDSIMSYGFYISKDSTFRSQLAFTKIVNPSQPLELGTLMFDVDYGLATDSTYYVIPYIAKQNFTRQTYNVKSFIWHGDRPIVIDSLYPLRAIMGDTLTLKGQRFAGRHSIVKFGDRIARLVSLNDSIIRIVVPNDLKEMNPLVVLQGNGRIDTLSRHFMLKAPEVLKFTNTGTFRDTIIVTGKNFGRFSGSNVVKFGNVLAKIVNFSETQLKAIVPDDIETSRTALTVAAQLQEVTATSQFLVRKPELILVPRNGTSYDEVVVKGKYFHPILSKNKVLFDGNVATITGGNVTELKMRIPFAPYPNRTAAVALKMLDYEVNYPLDLQLKEKWILINYNKPFRGYSNSNAFVLDGIPYIISTTADYTNPKMYLWKFNNASLSWDRLDFPFALRQVPLVTTVGGKAYVYVGGAALNTFWQYDPKENQWTKKAEYPSKARFGATIFTVGGDVYIGMGRDDTGFYQVPDNSFYKYDPITDAWSKETDYPTEFGNGERLRPSSFVIKGKVYIACGSTSTGMTQFYSYQPSNKSWQKLANFPHPRYGTTSFSYDNFGFIAAGVTMGGSGYDNDCFRYNVLLDRWEALPDRIGPHPVGATTIIDRGYSFVVGNRAFVGGGDSSTGINKLFMIDLQVLLADVEAN